MMAASHGLLKKLQVLRDKLELRRDDIAVGQAALADETRELASRTEQLNIVRAQVEASVKEMDEIGRVGRAEKAKREEWAHEEPILRGTFWTILDQGLQDPGAGRAAAEAQGCGGGGEDRHGAARGERALRGRGGGIPRDGALVHVR